MKFLTGSGKLSDGDGKGVIAAIDYRIWEKSGEWGGEFTMDRIIWPAGEYIIEMEDGRRGTCVIDLEQTVHNGCPIIYRYGLEGRGILSQKKEPT